MDVPVLPEVAPVERLMVTVGLPALISREVERFRKSELRTFSELSKDVAVLARDLVNGEAVPGASADYDYRSLLKDLAVGWDPQQVIDMLEAFPPALRLYGSAMVVKAKSVIDTLQTKYPQTNYVTATGSVSLVPADKKMFKFLQVFDVLCEPLCVFGLMSQGAIYTPQVDAVRLVYPTLSTAIDAALLDATVKAKAAKKSFELPPLTEVGVRRWFGKGPISTDSLKKAQASIERSNAKQDNKQDALANPDKERSQQTLTQRVESDS